MSDRNEVTLEGVVIDPPVVRTTRGGARVMNFRMLTESPAIGQGGDRYMAKQFHSVVVWDDGDDSFPSWVEQSTRCLVRGELSYRSWQNREGVKVTSAEVKALEVLASGDGEVDDDFPKGF